MNSNFTIGPVGTGLFHEFCYVLIIPMFFIFDQCERRKGFWFRLIPSVIVLLTLTYFQPTITLFHHWFVGFLFDFLLCLGIIYLCYDVPLASLFYYGTTIWCFQHIHSQISSVFAYFNRRDRGSDFFNPVVSYCRNFIIFCGLIVLFYVLVINHFKFQFNFMKKGRRHFLYITMIGIAVVYVISNFSITSGGLYNIYVLIYDIICCFLLLFFAYFLSEINHHEMQRAILDELQKQNSKQQIMRRENYESIAIRYHDLSKQLALLELEESSDSKQQIIQDIKGDLDAFGSFVETGNKALDVVLADKQMICLKNNIKLFYKVDAHVLDFVNEVDVYTIFSNLFDNAIESLKEEEKENKVIKLNIYKKGNIISIDCENYTSKNIVFKDNMPQTDKKQKEYHGYGTLSIKKVAKKYNGKVIYKLDNKIFHAYIILQNKSSTEENRIDVKSIEESPLN